MLSAKPRLFNSVYVGCIPNTHMLVIPPSTRYTFHPWITCPPPTVEWMPALEMMGLACASAPLGLVDGDSDGDALGELLGLQLGEAD